MAESKRKAKRLVTHIEYQINLIRKKDNPESGIDKAMRILKERFIKGKMEVTMEEQNLIDQEMAREMSIYPVMKTIFNLKKIEERWKRNNK